VSVFLFTLRRSGGNWITHLLSGGKTRLHEPKMPVEYYSDKDQGTDPISVRDTTAQCVQLTHYREFVRRFGLPPKSFFLFRHPVRQIRSYLWTLEGWPSPYIDDPQETVYELIREYKRHVNAFERSGKPMLKYEDAVTDPHAFIDSVYPAKGHLFYPYADSIQRVDFPLGQEPQGVWSPSAYHSINADWIRTETNVIERLLSDEMSALGYQRLVDGG
jgi:hypothetical protein